MRLTSSRNVFSFFVGGGDIEKDQFIGAFFGVQGAQFHRVAGIAQVHEVGALYGTAIFYIETGYDAFTQHA